MQLGLLMKQLDDRLARKNDQYYRIENDPIDLPGQGVATRLYGEDDAGRSVIDQQHTAGGNEKAPCNHFAKGRQRCENSQSAEDYCRNC